MRVVILKNVENAILEEHDETDSIFDEIEEGLLNDEWEME